MESKQFMRQTVLNACPGKNNVASQSIPEDSSNRHNMRILYDYQAFSRQFYGGVSRYFVELARLLSRLEDTEVRILAPLYINHYLKELDPGIVSGQQIAQA